MAILRPDTSTRKNLEILIILRFPQGQREKDLYWSLIGKEGHRSLINCHRRFFTLLFVKYYSSSLLLGYFVGCLIRYHLSFMNVRGKQVNLHKIYLKILFLKKNIYFHLITNIFQLRLCWGYLIQKICDKNICKNNKLIIINNNIIFFS